MAGRGWSDAESDSEGIEASSRGDAVARDMGRLIQGLNEGDTASVQRFAQMMKTAGADPEMAGVFNMVLDQLDPGARNAVVEAAGGVATVDAIQEAEAQANEALAADAGPAKTSPLNQNPRFAIATYGGKKLSDRLKAYGTADIDRGQVSNVAHDELGMVRSWQRKQLEDQGMNINDVKRLNDQQLTELAGMPSTAEFYRLADAAQARRDSTIGGSDSEVDSGLVGGHVETNLGGLSTAEARGRLLDSLIEAQSQGGRPLLNLPKTFPGFRARFPVGQLDGSPMGVELKYPNTQMSPDYYSGFFLDSIGREATPEALGRMRELMARSVDHYARLAPSTDPTGRGMGASEAQMAQEFAVPEVKGGIPLIRRMAEVDAGILQPAKRIQKHQKDMLSIKRYPEAMFTDQPINRGDNAPFFLKDVLIEPAAPAAEAPAPDAPMPADNQTSMTDYRNLPPQLLQMLLA